MIVLGISDSKPSSAAVMESGRILAAVAEERLCRMKMAGGMPRQAIPEVMKIAGLTAGHLDCIAVAQNVKAFDPEPVAWSSWFTEGKNEHSRFVRLGGLMAPLAGHVPGSVRAYQTMKGWWFRGRKEKLKRLLRDEYQLEAPLHFFDHHYCHATSAYFTSNFKDCLVVTSDGGGDGLSGAVYSASQGRLQRLTTVDSFHSLGNFYSYITELCGFKAERHEGKITGLAAYGQPTYADALREFIEYREPGKIRYKIPMYHSSALDLLSKKLPKDFDRADLAASVQRVFEEVGAAFVQYWLRQTGATRLAVAGGVFANVRFNQIVRELEGVEEFFVHPAMDDSGLSVGAAYGAQVQLGSEPAVNLVQRLPDVYLGPSYSDSEISSALENCPFTVVRDPNIRQTIAQLLAQGNVVARFHGRMEYGPRALGCRSILYQTTDPSVNDWLNEKLNRTEFMPFAPATLKEKAADCYHNLNGVLDTARFMTITADCTEEMKRTSPGVVHLDGTARPQLIDPESAPDFYGILRAYYELTGIPSLVNTSYNIHEEPIVCTPQDAVRAFQQSQLHYLAMDDWLVCNSAAVESQRNSPQGADAVPGPYGQPRSTSR